jgi:endogenous inhibitor of DNA gyrase (YacG/DUF329 family)
MIDLGAWATEQFRIPDAGDQDEPDEEGARPRPL